MIDGKNVSSRHDNEPANLVGRDAAKQQDASLLRKADVIKFELTAMLAVVVDWITRKWSRIPSYAASLKILHLGKLLFLSSNRRPPRVLQFIQAHLILLIATYL